MTRDLPVFDHKPAQQSGGAKLTPAGPQRICQTCESLVTDAFAPDWCAKLNTTTEIARSRAPTSCGPGGALWTARGEGK